MYCFFKQYHFTTNKCEEHTYQYGIRMLGFELTKSGSPLAT